MKRIMIAGWVTADDKYERYSEALDQVGAESFLSVEPDRLTEADGLLLPGSGQDINPKLWGEKDICSNDINDELDALQWKLMELAMEQKKPVLGICRGMQFINVLFGGTLIQDLPCASAHKAEQPERYHSVLHLPETFMTDLFGTESDVNSRHHQGVGILGDGLQPLSVWNDGEDCVTEAIWHEKYKMLGVQWHPERMFLLGDEKQKEDGGKLLQYFLQLS